MNTFFLCGSSSGKVFGEWGFSTRYHSEHRFQTTGCCPKPRLAVSPHPRDRLCKVLRQRPAPAAQVLRAGRRGLGAALSFPPEEIPSPLALPSPFQTAWSSSGTGGFGERCRFQYLGSRWASCSRGKGPRAPLRRRQASPASRSGSRSSSPLEDLSPPRYPAVPEPRGPGRRPYRTGASRCPARGARSRWGAAAPPPGRG